VSFLGSASRNGTEREKRHGARGASWERGRHTETEKGNGTLVD
jgi:hypothetical protein